MKSGLTLDYWDILKKVMALSGTHLKREFCCLDQMIAEFAFGIFSKLIKIK
jgi:hypothetical protein